MKARAFCLSLTVLFTFGAISESQIPAEKKTIETKVENLNVTMGLIQKQPDGRTVKIDWPAENATISVKTIPIEGRTVNELLHQYYIYPDVEAFGVLYALNPSLQKLNQLDTTTLRIPNLEGGQKLRQLFAEKALVYFTVDKELKDRFNKEVKIFAVMVSKIQTLESQQFTDAATRSNILASLGNVWDALKGIDIRIVQRTSRYVPPNVLEQLDAETKLLNSSFADRISSHKTFDADDLQRILDVQEDLKIKVKVFSIVAAGEPPARYPEVVVSVRTLKVGQDIPNLRIYYLAKALKNNPEFANSFGVLSSPAAQHLPEANYCFWGARDPDRIAVTNIQCQPVLDGFGSIQVQLTVNP